MDTEVRAQAVRFLESLRLSVTLPNFRSGADDASLPAPEDPFRPYKKDLLRCPVNIDFLLVLDKYPHLAGHLLQDPDLGRSLFASILQDKIDWATEGQSLVEVVADVRLSHLPGCFSQERRFSSNGFVSFAGLMASTTSAVEFVRSTSFCCSKSPDCPNSNVAHYRHLYLPGCEATAFELRSCPLCGSQIVEEPNRRDTDDYIMALFLPQAAAPADHQCFNDRQPSGNFRTQGILVLLESKWHDVAELGQKYYVSGQQIRVTSALFGAKEQSVVFCHHLQICRDHSKSWHIFSGGEIQAPPSLYSLFRESQQDSPWTWIIKLASRFGSRVCPPKCLLRLKLAMLFSLVSLTNESTDWPLPILAAGVETNLLNRLFTYGMTLAEKCQVASGDQMMPSASGIKIWNTSMIDAGKLLLASGGVCYLREIQELKKGAKSFLKTVFEEGTVGVLGSGLNLTQQPFRTGIWACCSLPWHKGNFTRAVDLFCESISQIIDLFGLVLIFKEETARDSCVADFFLQEALSEEDRLCEDKDFSEDSNVSFSDLKNVRNIKVSIEAEASDLLKRYFIACRRSRVSRDACDSKNKAILSCPMVALKTLTTIAESHAKLSMRDIVTRNDALFAIYFYERNAQALEGIDFGGTLLKVAPVEDCNESGEVAQMMGEFQIRLQEFLVSFAGDICSSVDVEE